jgi:hypothetical protein
LSGIATIRLTGVGHEFLDAARNERIWSKTKDILKKQALTLPFELMKQLLYTVLEAEIGA